MTDLTRCFLAAVFGVSLVVSALLWVGAL